MDEMFDLFGFVPWWWICWRVPGQGAAVRWIITLTVQTLQTWSPTCSTPTTNGLETHWEKDGERERKREGGGVRACPIVCGLSLETNYHFYSTLRSSGRSHCGVKSLAKACVILQNDWVESLTATGRKHVNTLTDACYIERLWWLFSRLGFHWTPPAPPSNESTTPRRQKDKNNLPNCFVIVCQGVKDIMSLLEESSCQNHNAWATSASASFGSILIFWKTKKHGLLFWQRIVVCERYPLLIVSLSFSFMLPYNNNDFAYVNASSPDSSTAYGPKGSPSEATSSPLALMFKSTSSTHFPVKHVTHRFTMITSCCIFSVSFSTPSSCHPEAILCDVGEFHCHDQETCIPEAWLCDGEPDCPDDSDETDKTCKSLIPSITH